MTTKNAIGLVSSVLFILFAFLLPNIGAGSSASGSKSVVLQFVDAYNDHDIEQMLEYCTDDIRWLTVSGDSIDVEAAGKASLEPQMQEHFRKSPGTRSEFIKLEDNGPMVVAIERAMTGSETGAHSQCSATVYQLRDNLIQNVWYFDVYKCGKTED